MTRAGRRCRRRAARPDHAAAAHAAPMPRIAERTTATAGRAAPVRASAFVIALPPSSWSPSCGRPLPLSLMPRSAWPSPRAAVPVPLGQALRCVAILDIRLAVAKSGSAKPLGKANVDGSLFPCPRPSSPLSQVQQQVPQGDAVADRDDLFEILGGQRPLHLRPAPCAVPHVVHEELPDGQALAHPLDLEL